jgi:hypothetical protein
MIRKAVSRKKLKKTRVNKPERDLPRKFLIPTTFHLSWKTNKMALIS